MLSEETGVDPYFQRKEAISVSHQLSVWMTNCFPSHQPTWRGLSRGKKRGKKRKVNSGRGNLSVCCVIKDIGFVISFFDLTGKEGKS